ncbi:Elongin-A, partial [Nibea albiflora]
MASSSDVVKKVTRFKLQLSDTAESATVLKILQKLKDLDITLDILAETGIGKTVNSLRRHEQAGELAKSLVRGWKRLVPKESTSHTEDGDVSESLTIKEKLDDQSCQNHGSWTVEDLNNNCSTSHDEALFKTGNRKAVLQKQCEELNENQEKSQQENQNISQYEVLKKKIENQEDETDNSFDSHEKKTDPSNRKSGDSDAFLGNENPEDNSSSGRLGSEKGSNKKSKPSKELSKEGKESFSFESSDKYSRSLDDRSSGTLNSSEAQNRKRKKTGKEKHAALKEPENKEHPKHKKAKIKPIDKKSNTDLEVPSMSFESCLNYDVKVFKRKERSGVKNPPKKIKTEVKDPGTKHFKSPMTSLNVTSPKQQFKESVMSLMNIPLPAVLPECDQPSSVEYFERRVEKETDSCDVSEESAGFTGQRLNKKMQVYSGAKTIFLPTMMSLHQQCIRTLQNNINLLYETGGVPFEILEPVLERCTPEQLLRIEEYNPIYIGVTDHLWGKHCQRDFKDSKLQEYESWKEMYVRLSEERERKLQRLTKSIVSAHSNKPKGRQVKMAFIHTVAKPPRDVRIQQEIHGTAVQQPHQLRCR